MPLGLRILGSPKRLCNGLTRRELLVTGGLGLCGLTMAGAAAASPAGAAGTPGHGFGRAKNLNRPVPLVPYGDVVPEMLA